MTPRTFQYNYRAVIYYFSLIDFELENKKHLSLFWIPYTIYRQVDRLLGSSKLILSVSQGRRLTGQQVPD